MITERSLYIYKTPTSPWWTRKMGLNSSRRYNISWARQWWVVGGLWMDKFVVSGRVALLSVSLLMNRGRRCSCLSFRLWIALCGVFSQLQNPVRSPEMDTIKHWHCKLLMATCNYYLSGWWLKSTVGFRQKKPVGKRNRHAALIVGRGWCSTTGDRQGESVRLCGNQEQKQRLFFKLRWGGSTQTQIAGDVCTNKITTNVKPH